MDDQGEFHGAAAAFPSAARVWACLGVGPLCREVEA